MYYKVITLYIEMLANLLQKHNISNGLLVSFNIRLVSHETNRRPTGI